jgi:hypothetical protein
VYTDFSKAFNRVKYGLRYVNDLKLYMTVKTVGDCHSFLDRLNERCIVNGFDLNARKCKAIEFRRNVRVVQFDYRSVGVLLDVLRKSKILACCLIQR